MKNVLYSVGVIYFLWMLTACNNASLTVTPSSREMIVLLDSMKQSAYLSGQYPYFTDKMVQKYERLLKGLPYTAVPLKRLDYVLVLVLKGENKKCVEEIEKYFKANNIIEVTHRNAAFFKVLALAHLRQGEIENCIHHHNGYSCIVPLQKEGVHQFKTGAEEAAKIYLKLLDFNPDDLQSKWFFNIAQMALGNYPENVPFQYIIPETVFSSDTLIPRFKNIALPTGVALNNHAGGSCLEDFNNDGLLDIFTTSYSLGGESELYLNSGNGAFESASDDMGIRGFVGGLNTIVADFNNDQKSDLFITRGAWLGNNGKIPNSLLINQGERFSDETKAMGVFSQMPTGTACAADVNLDGHLDLFIGNESTRASKFPCELYINDGTGHFKDMSKEFGLEINQFVKGAVWGDINNDMLPDLFVSIYGEANHLYVNRGRTNGRKWSFDDITHSAGLLDPKYSFTTWFWDYDNDGWQDIIVFGYDNRDPFTIAENTLKDYLDLPFKGETPKLYKNNGNETFTDVTEEVGLDKLLYVMGGNFGDINNDGYPDFYLGTGEFNIWASVPNRMFLNDGGQRFLDVTTAGGFGMIQKGHGVSFADIDNDGDQDIYHQVGGAAESDVYHNMLFENPGFGNNWISIRLSGVKANASGIGAKIMVEFEIDGHHEKRFHWVNTGGSFGANCLRAEIGIGKATKIDRLTVFWPDQERSVQKFSNIEINQFYKIVQGEQIEKLDLAKVDLLN